MPKPQLGMPRLGIVTALMAEAVPLIDCYRLQKQPKRPCYHHFSAGKIDLIVCGMGQKKLASGFSAYFCASPTPLPNIWLNLGIAGSKSDPIGALVWVSSIEGYKIGKPESAQNQKAIDVISLNKPSVDYKPNTLFDMEASAYLKCIRENIADIKNTSVFCAKVISDNAQENSLKTDKYWVTNLIRENLTELNSIIFKLTKT